MTTRLKVVPFVLIVPILLTFNTPALAEVPAKRYNTVLTKLEKVSGRDFGRRSKPVSNPLYRHRKSQLQSLRRSCKASAKSVRGTWYGGPNDHGTPGVTGYRGDNLTLKPDSFAELSMGTALGGLAYNTKRWIHYGKRSASARKRDIGAGGPRGPQIDLWHTLANRLGFVDGFVRLTVRPCRGVFR